MEMEMEMAAAPPRRPSSRPVSSESVERAVAALVKWLRERAKQRKAQLLEHDDIINLVFALKRIPEKGRTKAFTIPLPHPLHAGVDFGGGGASPGDGYPSTMCLIVDDSPKSALTVSAARDVVRSMDLPVSEVIGISELRSDYRPFEARRRLCDSYDLFFADRGIIPLLPRLLGKHFFKKKKIPLALNLSRKSWPLELRKFCASTQLYLRTGTCCGVKVGRVSQPLESIVENVLAAIDGAIQHVPKKWANIRSIHIKSDESAPLPIYQALPKISGLKIEALPNKKKKEKVVGGSDDIVLSKKKAGGFHEGRYLGNNRDAADSIEEDGDVLENNDHLSEGGDVNSNEGKAEKKIKQRVKVGAKKKIDKINALLPDKEGVGVVKDGLKRRKALTDECADKSLKKVKKTKMPGKGVDAAKDGLKRRKASMDESADKSLKKAKKIKVAAGTA